MPTTLTKEEKAAIAMLKKIAKRWPKSLVLFARSGAPTLTLSVRKAENAKSLSTATEVDWVSGILCVGGDDPESDFEAGVVALLK